MKYFYGVHVQMGLCGVCVCVLLSLSWCSVWWNGVSSAGPDLLAGCAQDRGGVWIYDAGAAVPGFLLPAECTGLSVSGHPHRHPLLPRLQEHHGRCAENQRWTPFQVSCYWLVFMGPGRISSFQQLTDLWLCYNAWSAHSVAVCLVSSSLTFELIIIIVAFKGAIRDFLQSPHRAANRLQHVCSSGPGATVCKSLATHRALITCKCHVTCHLVRRDSSAIKFDRVEIAFIWALFDWLNRLFLSADQLWI